MLFYVKLHVSFAFKVAKVGFTLSKQQKGRGLLFAYG